MLPDNKHEDGNCTGTHETRKQSSENPIADPFLKQEILFLIAGEISPFILFVFALAYKPMNTLQRFHVTFYNSIFTLSLWVAVCLNQKRLRLKVKGARNLLLKRSESYIAEHL